VLGLSEVRVRERVAAEGYGTIRSKCGGRAPAGNHVCLMGHTDSLGAKRADRRLWGYFISCPFCQSFWIALVLLLTFASTDAVVVLMSAVMYAYLA